MNFGLFRGFTWQAPATGASYPELKIRLVPYMANYTFGSGEIDTIVLVDSTSAASVELNGAGLKEGQCIHIAQWGASAVTVTNTDGLLRCAGTPQTRAQYSVVTATLVNSNTNEWLVFGDFAA